MPTFIALFSWTEPGVHDVKNTAKSAADFGGAIKEAGGAVKDIFWTMGRHEGVILLEAPDDATAAAVMMGGYAKGNVRSETLRAFPEKVIQGVLDKMQ